MCIFEDFCQAASVRRRSRSTAAHFTAELDLPKVEKKVSRKYVSREGESSPFMSQDKKVCCCCRGILSPDGRDHPADWERYCWQLVSIVHSSLEVLSQSSSVHFTSANHLINSTFFVCTRLKTSLAPCFCRLAWRRSGSNQSGQTLGTG